MIADPVHRLLGGALLAFLLACPGPARADDVEQRLRAMDLRQKVGQLFLVSFPGPEPSPKTLEFLGRTAPGGVVYYQNNTSSPAGMAQLSAQLQALSHKHSGVGLLTAIDMEGGEVDRFFVDRGFVAYPPAGLVAASGDPEAAAALGRIMARQLRAVGVRMNLAPVADLAGPKTIASIRSRSFGSDPAAVGRMVAAFVQATEEEGVLACAKHFPGHGAASGDSHETLPLAKRTRAQLMAAELLPFRLAVEAGVGAIMAAHVWFPDLDPAGPRPASLSEAVLSGLLRGDLGFGGLIVTDALDMGALGQGQDLGQVAERAILAGADLLLFGSSLTTDQQAAAVDHVIAAVGQGRIGPARIERSLRRVLSAKRRLGLLRPAGPASAPAFAPDQGVDLVRELFARAITLVRDRNALLPLTGQRPVLFLFGERHAAWVDACAPQVPGAARLAVPDPVPADFEAKLDQAAARAAVVVAAIHDPAGLAAQIRRLPPERVILVATGSPFALRAFPQVSTWLASYWFGADYLPVLCDVLLGRAVAGGRMPFDLLAGD